VSRQPPDHDPNGPSPRVLRFSSREVQDLLLAWVALSVAFALFFVGGGPTLIAALGAGAFDTLGVVLGVSALTAGVGFLLHELGHKVVAVRFGQVAEFRADYGMLFLAVIAATAGFLFAAPGAVHHRGMLTDREHGLIALAGPAVNFALVVVFLPVWVAGGAMDAGVFALAGRLGVAVNLLLGAFNLLPFGPLDGKTIRSWSTPVWAAFFVPSAVVGLWVLTNVNLL
jgi:Zn-dependent protease